MAKELANELRKERKLKEEKISGIHLSQLEKHTPEKPKLNVPHLNDELYNSIADCTEKESQDENAALQALRSLECDSVATLKKLEQEQRDQELARKMQLLETTPNLTQEEIDKKLAMEAQDEGM